MEMRCNRRRPQVLQAIAGEMFECLVGSFW